MTHAIGTPRCSSWSETTVRTTTVRMGGSTSPGVGTSKVSSTGTSTS